MKYGWIKLTKLEIGFSTYLFVFKRQTRGGKMGVAWNTVSFNQFIINYDQYCIRLINLFYHYDPNLNREITHSQWTLEVSLPGPD